MALVTRIEINIGKAWFQLLLLNDMIGYLGKQLTSDIRYTKPCLHVGCIFAGCFGQWGSSTLVQHVSIVMLQLAMHEMGAQYQLLCTKNSWRLSLVFI